MTNRNSSLSLILEWMSFSIGCIKETPLLSIINGLMFTGVVNILVILIGTTTYTDISLPIAGITILILGPIMALNLYLMASRYHQKLRNYNKKIIITSNNISSVLFVSFCLLLLMLLYLMFIPSIYAITSNVLSSGVGLQAMIQEAGGNPLMIVGISIWSAFMGWVAFSISWFSFPMIISNKISGAKSIIYSIKMSYHHFPLLLLLGVFVISLVTISLLSPLFSGFIITIPLLAYATFDCNRILSREIKDFGDDGLKYNEKLGQYCNTIEQK